MLFPRKARKEEFEAVALPHLRALYRTAARLFCDPAQADDLVQDVYLQAWKSFDRFEPGTNSRAWLYRILFNMHHHHRRKWFNVRVINESQEFLEASATYTAPVSERITDEEILSALDGVPDEFRAVVLLVDVEEFSYREAAGILNVPIGTVMSRLNRGRKILRERLAGVAVSYGIGKTRREAQSA